MSFQAGRDVRSRLPCGFVPANDTGVKVMVIRPSTMWFTQGVQIKDIHVKTRYIHRVCYSFHSSFSEVRDFVTYLKPRRVYPNVIPMNQTVEQVGYLLLKKKLFTTELKLLTFKRGLFPPVLYLK